MPRPAPGPEPFFALAGRTVPGRPGGDGPRPAAVLDWGDLTEEKIAAIPLLAARRAAR